MRTRWLKNVFVVTIFILLPSLISPQDQNDEALSGSFSGSRSVSVGADMGNQLSCFFRGVLKYHKATWKVDDCTVCVCANGTSKCDIVSCLPPRCRDEASRVVGECCLQCPPFMTIASVENLQPEGLEFTEGQYVNMKFDISIGLFKPKTARKVEGENLWKVSAWVSSTSDGTVGIYSLKHNILRQRQRQSQSFFKPEYPPFVFRKLKYSFDASEGCEKLKFFCVKFSEGEESMPKFNLSFTFGPLNGDESLLVDCVPLGECKGVFPQTLEWELDSTDPIPGQVTPVSLDMDVTFREDSRDLSGEGLWRVSLFGSTNIEGDGDRFGEVVQVLDEAQQSTSIANGRPLGIDDINTDFEIGTVGCTNNASFVCMEFSKGLNSDPDYTMIIQTGRGDISQDTLILCKPQECGARAIFSELEAAITTPEYIIENTSWQAVTVSLDAMTDKAVSTSVVDDSLLISSYHERKTGMSDTTDKIMALMDDQGEEKSREEFDEEEAGEEEPDEEDSVLPFPQHDMEEEKEEEDYIPDLPVVDTQDKTLQIYHAEKRPEKKEKQESCAHITVGVMGKLQNELKTPVKKHLGRKHLRKPIRISENSGGSMEVKDNHY